MSRPPSPEAPVDVRGAPTPHESAGAVLRRSGREVVVTAHLPTLALWAAAAVAALAVLSLVDAPPTEFWALDGFLGLPTLLSAAALLAAALGAVALSDERRQGAWLLAAILLLALGIEQLGSLHERATQRLGVPDAALAAPPIALALVIAALALRSRAMLLAAGAVGFAAALCLDLVTSGRVAEEAVGALELASSAAILLGVVATLQQREGWRPVGRRADYAGLGARLVAASPPVSVAKWMAAVIALLAIAGLAVNVGDLSVHSFDMNEERTVPAFVSGAILFAAGALAFLLASLDGPGARRWWLALAWSFVILGADEVAAVHEVLQDETGVKGQVFLAPLVVVAAAAWLAALRRLEDLPPARALLVGGAAAWALSQVLDVLQTGPQRDHPTVVPEEVLEMAGSGMFVLALLLAARRLLPAS